jgi:hypothetical protein
LKFGHLYKPLPPIIPIFTCSILFYNQ